MQNNLPKTNKYNKAKAALLFSMYALAFSSIVFTYLFGLLQHVKKIASLNNSAKFICYLIPVILAISMYSLIGMYMHKDDLVSRKKNPPVISNGVKTENEVIIPHHSLHSKAANFLYSIAIMSLIAMLILGMTYSTSDKISSKLFVFIFTSLFLVAIAFPAIAEALYSEKRNTKVDVIPAELSNDKNFDKETDYEILPNSTLRVDHTNSNPLVDSESEMQPS